MTVFAYTLFSSSKGNSSYFTDGETSFLIDAGGSGKRIEEALRSLNASPCDISAIFITHEHCDHTDGLKGLCRKTAPAIHTVLPSAEYIEAPGIVTHGREYEVKLGAFTVKSFATSHDSACSVGYVIEHKSGLRIGSMTDTGFVSEEMTKALEGCCAVILESNYDEQMLKNGPYPPELKRRIASEYGHLSNSQSAAVLPCLYKSGARRVLLAHISPENNTPETAFECADSAIKRYSLYGMSAEPAKRYEITRLI